MRGKRRQFHAQTRSASNYFVDAVEARLKQDFELRRKKNGAHFTPEELLSAADGADAMFVTPALRPTDQTLHFSLAWLPPSK